MNKSAASAASPDYVKFQAVLKSAASAASLRRGPAGGRLDHGHNILNGKFLTIFAILNRFDNAATVNLAFSAAPPERSSSCDQVGCKISS